MKIMIKLGLLFIGVLLCSSCEKENEMPKQDVTTPTTTGTQVAPEKNPELNKMLQGDRVETIFRYDTEGNEFLQVVLYPEEVKFSFELARFGNIDKLGSTFGDLGEAQCGEWCNFSYDVNTHYLKLDIQSDNLFWLKDIIWLKYNPDKDVLEVKLKTPLIGEGKEPIVYELKRVAEAIYMI